MNVLDQNIVESIRSHFDKGDSIRVTADATGAHKNTVFKYFNTWRFEERSVAMVSNVSQETKDVWQQEAERRGMSRQSLHSLVLELIADDNLFEAILGDLT